MGAWIPSWAFAKGVDSARASKGTLTDGFLFALHLDDAGMPALACPDQALVNAGSQLRQLGTRTWLTVVNDRVDAHGTEVMKDPLIVHQIVTSDALRKPHIAALVRLCQTYHCIGLDLDYENLNAVDRDAFSQFVTELGAALHASKLQLSVSLEAKVADNASGSGRAADWSKLGLAADRLQIMLYNLHYAKSEPGPVTAPSWIAKVLGFAETQCEHAKIVPALKFAGFEWGPKPRSITFAELNARRLMNQAEFRREPEGLTPYLTYIKDGAKCTAYVDDAISLRAKLKFLRDIGYPQATLWSLGAEDPTFWEDAPAPEAPVGLSATQP